MHARDVMALDIGGANLKWSHGDGRAGSVPFAVWQRPEALAGRIDALCAEHRFELLLVTMTAELCDCFATRAAGVGHVLDAVEGAQRPVKVWSMSAGFVDVDAARARPMDVGAANWQALATWAARQLQARRGMLVDVGSTTSDLIPLADGRCAARGLTDTQRLATGELIYLGAQRTPLMAVTPCVTLGAERIGVMAEHFATMDDAMALIEGRGGDEAARRVLRMIGADLDTHTHQDAAALARCFVDAACARLAEALGGHRGVEAVLVSGSGESLAGRAVADAFPEATVHRLSDIIGPAASCAACAVALVRLWSERCMGTSTS